MVFFVLQFLEKFVLGEGLYIRENVDGRGYGYKVKSILFSLRSRELQYYIVIFVFRKVSCLYFLDFEFVGGNQDIQQKLMD